MSKNKLLIGVGVAVLLLSTAAFTFAFNRQGWNFHLFSKAPVETVPVNIENKMTANDKNTVKRVLSVLSAAMNKTEISISGSITMLDPTDSTASGKKSFTYVRKGDECFYALGEVEIISLKDVYIICNNETKRIIISPARKMDAPLNTDGEELIQTFVADGYSLREAVNVNDSVFVVSCPNHVACKEYSYSIDMAKQEIHELKMRLTDISDPLNDSLDKQVIYRMDNWSYVADASYFRREKYLSGKGGNYTAAANYKGFEIVSSL